VVDATLAVAGDQFEISSGERESTCERPLHIRQDSLIWKD
jgi:hypothetical protein